VAGAVLIDRAGRTPKASTEPPGRQTIAVLPLADLTKSRDAGDWPLLIQSLLAGELTGASDVAVMDPLGLNGLLEDRGSNPSLHTDRRTLDLLRRAKVTLAIGGRIVLADRGYQLLVAVIDTAGGESAFAARAAAADERGLTDAVKSVADQILSFLQVSVLREKNDRDLRPWIVLRRQNIEAVKAFVEGSQYIYRRQREEGEKYLRRAIELDPSFIAPKVWLISTLERKRLIDEAESTYRSLLALEPTASPFERAMIAYTGARLRGDSPGQERYLEVALGFSPGNNILLLRLADLRLSAGDCAGALEAMRPAIEIRWPYGALYPYWAFCSVEVGNIAEARDAVRYARRFTQTDPQEVGLLEALAIAAEDPESAAWYGRDFAARFSDKPTISKQLVDVYDRIGTDCLRASRFAAAAKLFEKAVAAEPRLGSHRNLLAQAYDGLGNRSDAAEQRRQASAAGSSGTERK
jgi:tetratricopeptide (TPR) repeat protein